MLPKAFVADEIIEHRGMRILVGHRSAKLLDRVSAPSTSERDRPVGHRNGEAISFGNIDRVDGLLGEPDTKTVSPARNRGLHT